MSMLLRLFVVTAILVEITGFTLKMNTVLVFGGTGKCGSEACYQALKQGYKVVTLARTPSKLTIPMGSGGSLGGAPFKDPNLTVLEGSVTDLNAVDRAFKSATDVVGK